MTVRIDVKSEGKLTFAFENDMKNLAKFRSQAEKQRLHFRKSNDQTK